jgi:hypothetical protein
MDALNAAQFEETAGQFTKKAVMPGLLNSWTSRTYMALSYLWAMTGIISPSWHIGVSMPKKTAIKVLTNKSKDAVLTLPRCKMFVDISLIPSEFYHQEQPSEEGDEEHHSGGGVEEQPPGHDADDEATVTINTDTEDDDLEVVNGGDKKPAAVSMEDVFGHELTQCSIPDNHNVPQSALEVAQSTTANTGNVAQSTSTSAQSNTQLAPALSNNASKWDGLSLSPWVIHTLCPVL